MKVKKKDIVNIDEDKYKIFWIESVDGIPELKEKQLSAEEYLNQENTPEQERNRIFKEENGFIYYKSRWNAALRLEVVLEETQKSLKEKIKLVGKKIRENKKTRYKIPYKCRSEMDSGYVYAPYIPLISSQLVSVQPMTGPVGNVFSMNIVTTPIKSKSKKLISPGVSTKMVDTSSLSHLIDDLKEYQKSVLDVMGIPKKHVDIGHRPSNRSF